MMAKPAWLLVGNILALALAASAFAQAVSRAPSRRPGEPWAAPEPDGARNDYGAPGSVLVFPRFEIGQVFTPDQGPRPRTQFEISVTCPERSAGTESCAPSRVVRLKARWVCAGNADRYCKAVEFDLVTKVNGTVVFDTDNVLLGKGFKGAQSVPPPSCDAGPGSDLQRGYLVVWVVDDSGRPIKFDGLIGDGVRRDCPVAASAFSAVPIQAAECLETCQLIPLNDDGSLPFDGKAYRAVAGKVFGSARYDDRETGLTTSLTLLTLDVQANRVNDPTHVDLDFYDQDGQVRSGSRDFVCWGDAPLSGFGLGLDTGFGTKGLVESTGAVRGDRRAPLIGIIESQEAYSRVIEAPAHVSWTMSGLGGFPFRNCTIPSGGACQTICTWGFYCRNQPDPLGNCPDSSVTADFSCTLVTDTVTQTIVPQVRGYAYPLFNDGEPAATGTKQHHRPERIQ